MSSTEHRIINALRKDARMTLAKIAELSGLPTSTVYDRMRKLKSDARFTAHINFAQYGYPLRVLLIMNAQGDLNYLKEHPSINSFYRLEGKSSYCAEAHFRSFKELREFIEDLPLETEVHCNFVSEELKHEAQELP